MKWIAYALILLLPAAIILASFRIVVFDKEFYTREYEKYSIYNELDKELVDENTDKLIGYLSGNNGLDTSFFNEKEKMHLSDVKQLINGALNLLYVLIIASLLMIAALLYKKKYHHLGWSAVSVGCITILLLIITAIIFGSDFSNVFLNFHLISFDNDLWMLNPATDKLIVMFPEGFFYDISLRMMFIAGMMSIAVIWLVILSLYHDKKNINIS